MLLKLPLNLFLCLRRAVSVFQLNCNNITTRTTIRVKCMRFSVAQQLLAISVSEVLWTSGKTLEKENQTGDSCHVVPVVHSILRVSLF